jgi:hypothetical protein
MRQHVQELVAAAARALAGKAHTEAEMHDALYQLAIDIRSPTRLDDHRPNRRMPLANEVLPRHQRASWAREKTVHDRDEQ